MKKILIAFGTRPEVIKLSPVIMALRDIYEIKVLHSGQHKELVDPLLSLFGIQPDISLDIMQPGQDLFDITQNLLPKLKNVLLEEKPDQVMVQGDTTTSYLTALAAFYLKIPVLHVEAGLRSRNRYYPFPEEINRRQISLLANIHFAPTKSNKENLLREGISPETIFLTGNTVIDALNFIKNSKDFEQSKPESLREISPDQKLIVLTAHRRENHGKPLQNVFKAVKTLLNNHKELVVIFPAHPNPSVHESLKKTSISSSRFMQIPPADYLTFLHILERADLILSDSGGIQEEAATLGKPILVLREETERQELIEAGLGSLVGTDPEKIISYSEKLLSSGKQNDPSALFGDGKAALKIKEILKDQL